MISIPLQPFEEYRVTPRQVERAAARDIAASTRNRQADQLTPWKTGNKPDLNPPAHRL